MLSLPVEVVCDYIFSYLSLSDMHRLDIAFTNQKLRPQLNEVWDVYKEPRFMHISTKGIAFKCIGKDVVDVTFCHSTNVSDWTEIKHPKMKSIRFRGKTIVTDAILDQIARGCRVLEELETSSCASFNSDVGVKSLAQHCHQLRSISLWSSSITDASIAALCDNCPHLQSIDVFRCKSLSDASLKAIASTYPHLKSIDMGSLPFTDESLALFANHCRELQSVSCSPNGAFSGFAALWAANPNVVKVTVYSSKYLTDDYLSTMVRHCRQLRELNISSCEQITDAAVIAVAEHCQQLTSLDISFCERITDAAVTAVAEHCPQLTSIDIYSCCNLSDTAVIALAKHCPKLTKLSVSYCNNITDAALIVLGRRCHGLEDISLRSVRSISDVGVVALAEGCPLLRFVDISETSVTDDGIGALKRCCPKVHLFT